MWNIIKEYRHYLATLFLVVIPIVAVNTGGKSPAELHWFDRAAVGLTNPVQSAIRWSIESSWDLVESYLLLVHTKSNNTLLAEENLKLLSDLAAFEEVAKENDRLKKIVDFHSDIEGNKIVARVVAQDVSPEYRMFRLNKGSAKGVQSGMAVVSIEGIVGRVIRVSTDYSDVLTLLDTSSSIDALLQRNRVRGVIEGMGGQTLSMKYLRRTDEVQEGDMIVSSGIGGFFPKGLNIGKVISVRKKNYGISQTVEVAPAVDFHRLEEVILVEPPKVPLEQTSLDLIRRPEKTEHKEGTKAKKTEP